MPDDACRQACYERTDPRCRQCLEDAWVECGLVDCGPSTQALRACQEEHGCDDYELMSGIDNCTSRSCGGQLRSWSDCRSEHFDAYMDCLFPREEACMPIGGDVGPLDCWGVLFCGIDYCTPADDPCRQACWERATPECHACLDDAWLTCNLRFCEATTQALRGCQEQHGCQDYEVGLSVGNCSRDHCLELVGAWEDCRRGVSIDDYEGCHDPRVAVCRDEH